jgi:hypothetical protein
MNRETGCRGTDDPEVAEMFKSGSNEYLAGLVNDTRVFAAIDEAGRWCGVATLDAIKARGYRPDASSWGYFPKAWLIEGWAFTPPLSR